MNYKEFAILFVDDDMSNLAPLKEVLENQFTVDVAQSGEEALKRLKEREYAILLADQRMEPMDGVELLSRSRELYPKTIRMIITGYADYQASVDAINRAQVHQYIFKSPGIAHEIVPLLQTVLDYYWERQERVRLQRLVMRDHKLTSLGIFAAGLAHELRNPLTAIKTFAALLPQKHQDPDFREKFQELVQKDIARVSGLIDMVLKLTASENVDWGMVDIHQLVDEVERLMNERFQAGKIEFVKRCECVNPRIKADRRQLMQLFMNLFLNAVQAMEKSLGGKIEVATERDLFTVRGLNGQESHFVRIRVSDNGPGIDEKILSRIFDPFVTTHNTGDKDRGAGLGLFLAHKIIHGHHGYIDVQSSPGKGTTFIIDLPLG